MDQVQAAAAQDALRPARNFISTLSAVFGVNDQTYAGQDGVAVNTPGQYQTIGSGMSSGAVSVEGKPVSSAQAGAMFSPAVLLGALLVVAFLALRK